MLGLGMLGCMQRAFGLLAEHRGIAVDIEPPSQPRTPVTYAMIRRADTLGTFQIESRAQMSMLPRLKPTTFYDLVVQGGDRQARTDPGRHGATPTCVVAMVSEPVSYPKEELRRVLGKTLGVPLFQEQAMQVAIHCAGFTPGEADQLRRSMATFKITGGVSHFRDKLIEGDGGSVITRASSPSAPSAQVGGLWQLWLSGEPRRLLRASGLRLRLDEVPPPGRVLCRAAQQPADGLLRTGAGGARCARARHRGSPGLRQRQPLGLHAGACRR